MRYGRKTEPKDVPDDAPRSFDDFQVTLGDRLRGERATLGKSLLDVQRELKIKASYIAAIENTDTSAFETPGFIAGYVRSYARYLGVDPEWAFQTFCREAGFETAHGMSAAASSPSHKSPISKPLAGERDIFADASGPYAAAGSDVFGRVEMSAIGSVAVLALIVGAIGWGGFSVLQEVQRVQLAPVNAAPGVVSDVDPLAPAGAVLAEADTQSGVIAPPTPEALDRLYRPQALDTPVLIARDGPIASLDPREQGVLGGRGMPPTAPETTVAEAAPVDAGQAAAIYDTRMAAALADESPLGAIDGAVLAALAATGDLPPEDASLVLPAPDAPLVTAGAPDEVALVAVRETWVRVRSSDGSTLYETVMQPGDTYALPSTEVPPTLRTGNAGGVYFSVGGRTYGPAGDGPEVLSNLALDAQSLTQTFAAADPAADGDLARVVAELAPTTVSLPAQ